VPDLSGADGAGPDCADAAPIANINTVATVERYGSELLTIIMGHPAVNLMEAIESRA
jgi:hypothetical protein